MRLKLRRIFRRFMRQASYLTYFSFYCIVGIITIWFSQNTTYNFFIKQGNVVMEIVDYGPLWETMKQNNVTQYQLLQGGIDNHTLDSLKKGGNITMLTLEKLCKIIGCTPNDVVSFK